MTPKRLHPLYMAERIFRLLKWLWLPLLVIMGVASALSPIAWLLIGMFLLVLFVFLHWWNFIYYFDASTFYVEHGILNKQKRTFSFEAIQSVDITVSLVQGILGLSRLRIDTAAGARHGDIVLMIQRSQAEEIKQIILVAKGQSHPMPTHARKETGTVQAPVFQATWRDLFILSITSNDLFVGCGLMLSFYSHLDGIVKGAAGDAFPIHSMWLTTLLDCLLVVAILVFSIVRTLMKYAGFQVIRTADSLVLTYGLFNKKDVTIPVGKIQAISVREPFVRMPFSLVSLTVDTIGYGKEKGEQAALLYPLLRKDRLPYFFQSLLPEFPYDTDFILQRPPKKSLRRFLIGGLYKMPLLVAGVVGYFYSHWFLLVFLPLALWIGKGFMNYKHTGIYAKSDLCITQRFSLGLTTTYIWKKALEDLARRQNPFQRRLRVADLLVTISQGGGVSKHFRVSNMEPSFYEQLIQWRTEKGTR